MLHPDVAHLPYRSRLPADGRRLEPYAHQRIDGLVPSPELLACHVLDSPEIFINAAKIHAALCLDVADHVADQRHVLAALTLFAFGDERLHAFEDRAVAD